MKRRRFLAVLGTTAAGSFSVVGTGAFSSTSADRKADVSIVRNDDAYLRLTAADTNFAYTDSNGLLQFEFDGDFRDRAGGTNTGDGLGTDSIYEFADLFHVENQGANNVRVYGQYRDPDGMKSVKLFDSDDPERSALTESSPSQSIAPGSVLTVGMRIDTHGIDIDNYETSIAIRAMVDDEFEN